MQKLTGSDEHWGVPVDSSSVTVFWFWGESTVNVEGMKTWLEGD